MSLEQEIAHHLSGSWEVYLHGEKRSLAVITFYEDQRWEMKSHYGGESFSGSWATEYHPNEGKFDYLIVLNVLHFEFGAIEEVGKMFVDAAALIGWPHKLVAIANDAVRRRKERNLRQEIRNGMHMRYLVHVWDGYVVRLQDIDDNVHEVWIRA